MYKLQPITEETVPQLSMDECKKILGDVEVLGPQFIKSKGGTVYMVTSNTGNGYCMIKILKETLHPWITIKNQESTIKDLMKGCYVRVEGDIIIKLDVAVKG